MGVVARYGPLTDVQRLVAVASAAPTVLRLDIARACGCCLRAA